MPPCRVVPPGKTSFQSELVISGQKGDHRGDLERNGAGCLCVFICPVHTSVFLHSCQAKCDPNAAILEKATRHECLYKKIIFLNQEILLLILSFCRLVFKIHASALNITMHR